MQAVGQSVSQNLTDTDKPGSKPIKLATLLTGKQEGNYPSLHFLNVKIIMCYSVLKIGTSFSLTRKFPLSCTGRQISYENCFMTKLFVSGNDLGLSFPFVVQ